MKPYTRRYRDLKIRYDMDFPDRTLILRQRTYKTAGGEAETPITPLLQAREVASDCPAPRAKPITPRRAIACFPNPSNVAGLSELQVMSPYRPTDPLLRQHLSEIRAAPNVASVRYLGETHEQSVEPYL